jgi:hypothetical protein
VVVIGGLSIYASASQGMRRAMDGIRREAQTVAHGIADGSTADLTGAMARSLGHQRAAEDSAAALRCTDRTLGSSIDILV